MVEPLINIKLIEEIRNYLKLKTGKLYFRQIRQTGNNLIVTCPFHKGGQESKPSASIRITNSDRASIGLFSCFTCHENMMLSNVLKQILGPLYDEDEVEARFGLKVIEAKSSFIEPEKQILFKLPDFSYIKQSEINNYKFYHPYLKNRRITEDVANIYDLGFDKINKQIVFPIYNLHHKCIGLGRRSIDIKKYYYPYNMQKPLYGLYELDPFINYLHVVEGPFNLWSLRGWNKQGVALLGTGTELQYKQLLEINCKGFVLELDPDEAGRKGINKLGQFLQENHKKVFVTLLPDGKDINDLLYEDYKQLAVITFKEWKDIYKI